MWIVRGASDGPEFHLMGGQHGVEVNGCAALMAFVQEIDVHAMAGTLRVVPVAFSACVFAGLQYPRMPDGVEDNLNRVWPGHAEGNQLERLAWAIWSHGLSTAQYCVDVHAWSRHISPAALCGADSEPSLALAHATGLPLIRVNSAASSPQRGYAPLMARHIGAAKAACAIELRGQYVVHADQIELGKVVFHRVLAHVGMLEGGDAQAAVPQVDAAEARVPVESPVDGFLHARVDPGDTVTAGQVLGTVYSNEAVASPVTSPVAGVVCSIGVHHGGPPGDRTASALVRRGQQVACVVASEIE